MAFELSKDCIEEALKISGYSKYRLAKESGIPLRSIQRWFNTDLKINYETLLKLCEIMDVDPYYLHLPYSYEDEDDEGRKFTIVSYHYSNKLSKKEIQELPPEERKRVDRNGVYVAHYSKELMSIQLDNLRSLDCSKIMAEYIRTLARLDQIDNASYVNTHPNIVMRIVFEIRDVTDKAIEKTVKEIMKEKGNEDQ